MDCSGLRRYTGIVPSTSASDFRFFRHFDYGLLREADRELQFDMWDRQARTWQRIILDPFTASMSPLTEPEARSIAGGELLAPIVAREVRPGVVEPV